MTFRVILDRRAVRQLTMKKGRAESDLSYEKGRECVLGNVLAKRITRSLSFGTSCIQRMEAAFDAVGATMTRILRVIITFETLIFILVSKHHKRART